MLFDVTLRVRVEGDTVYVSSLDTSTREQLVEESVLNAFYDCDDLAVLRSYVEEISIEY